jgi:PAS domain S-box-containing protein
MLAAGFLPRLALPGLGFLCAVLTEAFSSLDPAWRISRVTFGTLAFAGCGLFVSELLRNRRLSLETQQRLRALIETNPAAIVTVSETGVIELANRATGELFGSGAGNPPIGQPIAAFVPELQNALSPNTATGFRAAMQCLAHRSRGEDFLADVWFSTYRENGSKKLAAIIADVSEEQSSDVLADSVESGRAEPELNSRQAAVLRLVLEGLTNAQISSRLDITGSAVKNTLQQLFSKAKVNNRSQLVRVALEHYRDLL